MAVFSFPFVWIIILGLFVAVALATYYLTTPSSGPPGPSPPGDADIIVDFAGATLDPAEITNIALLAGTASAPIKPFSKQIVNFKFTNFKLNTEAGSFVEGININLGEGAPIVPSITVSSQSWSSEITQITLDYGFYVLGMQGAGEEFTFTVDFGVPVTDDDITSGTNGIIWFGPSVGYADYGGATLLDNAPVGTSFASLTDIDGIPFATGFPKIDPTFTIVGYNYTASQDYFGGARLQITPDGYNFSPDGPAGTNKLNGYVNGDTVTDLYTTVVNPLGNIVTFTAAARGAFIGPLFFFTIVDTNDENENYPPLGVSDDLVSFGVYTKTE
jgi:hypothetical protein